MSGPIVMGTIREPDWLVPPTRFAWCEELRVRHERAVGVVEGCSQDVRWLRSEICGNKVLLPAAEAALTDAQLELARVVVAVADEVNRRSRELDVCIAECPRSMSPAVDGGYHARLERWHSATDAQKVRWQLARRAADVAAARGLAGVHAKIADAEEVAA